jgi:hypothetical protein
MHALLIVSTVELGKGRGAEGRSLHWRAATFFAFRAK